MTFLQKMADGAALVSGMAQRLDIDIADRVAASPETAGRSYAAMVERCARCSDHEACARRQADNPMLDAAPDYCMNRTVLHR